MKKYQVVVMAFDGEYKREEPMFETIEDAWRYENDLGSKWFFYPFHFVVSGNRVVGAPWPTYDGKYLKTIVRRFAELSKLPCTDIDTDLDYLDEAFPLVYAGDDV